MKYTIDLNSLEKQEIKPEAGDIIIFVDTYDKKKAEDQIYAALDAEILKRQRLEDELRHVNYQSNTNSAEAGSFSACQCPCHKEGLWKKVPELEAELDQVYGKMEYIMWKLNTHTAVGETIQAWFNSEGRAIRGVR